jgi:hypothetical protein
VSHATVNDRTHDKPERSADAVAEDPRPESPVQPEPEECCNSGCSPCVFDLYDEALARYRVALAEWRVRHPDESGRA